MQQGFQAGQQAERGWIDLTRGMERESEDEHGKVGHVSDEITNRGFWLHYRDVMAARA